MTDEESLRAAFSSLEVNESYSTADLRMRDESRLCFCHRVGERWAKAMGRDDAAGSSTQAGQVLSRVSMFRLNAKHLDIQFADGTRWEARFRDSHR